MNILIVGFGAVGKAMHSVVAEYSPDSNVGFLDLNDEDTNEGHEKDLDVMHICIPFSNDFVDQCEDYINDWKPELVIINSTVELGTCELLRDVTGARISHVPIRGIHCQLKNGIMWFPVMIGATSKSALIKTEQYYRNELEFADTNIHICKSSRETELGKLLSTTTYGVHLEWTRQMKAICDSYGVDFNEAVTKFTETYNEGYESLDLEKFIRPVLTPVSNDGCGGHCVIENGIILFNNKYNSIVKQIFAMGKSTTIIPKYNDRSWLFCEYIGKDKTTEQIGRECNVSSVTIQNWLKRFNIKRRHAPWTEDENKLLEELSLEMTFKDISDNNLFPFRTYDSIRYHAIVLGIKSCYDPSERTLSTRKKISCTLQGIALEDFDKFTPNHRRGYKQKMYNWRSTVFQRDNYTCQNTNCEFCNNNKGVTLNAHHIKRWSKYPDDRFNIDNGITYCYDHHKSIHFDIGRNVNATNT